MGEKYTAIIGIVWLVLTVISRWILFRKARKPGFFSIIPILSDITEYNICWTGWMVILAALAVFGTGLLGQMAEADPTYSIPAAACALVCGIIHLVESIKLGRSFGKGFFYGLLLTIFPHLFRMFLGLGAAEYKGKP